MEIFLICHFEGRELEGAVPGVQKNEHHWPLSAAQQIQ